MARDQPDPSLAELIPPYLDGLRDAVEALRGLVEDKGSAHATEIEAIGHRLRGSGGTYGFETVTSLGERLEAAGATADLAAARTIVEELSTWLDRQR